MNSAEVRALKIGDSVSFKCDIEQVGRFVRADYRGPFIVLRLQAPTDEGFEGDYIGGADSTFMAANDCWTE